MSAPLAAQKQVKMLDRIIAVVENDLITANELRVQTENAINALRQQNERDINERELVAQVLQQLIMKKLQLQEAERLGIRADEETLDKTLENIASRNQLSLSDLKEKVEAEGGDYSQFRQNVQEEITLMRLVQQEVINKIEVSEQEIENHLQAQGLHKNRRWRLAYLQVLPDGDAEKMKERTLAVYQLMRKETVASSRRLEALFQQKWRALFGEEQAAPDYRLQTLYWRKEQLPKSQQARSGSLQDEKSGWLISNSRGIYVFRLLATERDGDQIMQTQYLSQHILITPTPLDSDEQLRGKLSLIKEKIEKGGDFAEYARRYSKDPGSASKGGQLDWLSANQVVEEFAQALEIGRQRGGVVGPFKTQYGWHILETLDVREKNVTELVLRDQAASEIKKSKADKKKREWLLELRETRKIEIRL